MPLETGNSLDDLNSLWPTQDDGVNTTHRHLQLLKAVLKSAFGANPSPLEFNADLVFGGYLKSSQVTKAGAAVAGATGAIRGASVGLGPGLISRISPGTYEVQLAESFNFDDLHFSFNVDYGFGGLGIATMIPATVNTDGTWVQIVTVLASDVGTPADPSRFSFAIEDFGR